MEAAVGQVSKHDGRAGGGTDAIQHRDAPSAARPQPSSAGETLPPLPQRGDTFTEDQMRERFGVPRGDGVRESYTSSDIILVRSAGGGGDAVEGGRVIYDGQYYEGQADQMILGNLRLARSQESGDRVLYFVKEDGKLVFDGLVECLASRRREAAARPGALAFELERIDGGATVTGRQDVRCDRRGVPLGSRASSASDLDMVATVERQISGRGRFAGRSGLLAALPKDMDSASLDRIPECPEHSAKISAGDEGICWTFNDAGQQGPNPSKKASASLDAAATAEPVYILSRGERRSADLDNDLPYSEDIEQMIADCEAGRPIGKTYTAEEYRRHLKQEFGIGALVDTRK